MPDMAYSRAYETYAPHQELKDRGINYTCLPVAGTIPRGETFPFSISKDTGDDSTNYVASNQVANPLPALEFSRAKRRNVCTSSIVVSVMEPTFDGNGPLYKWQETVHIPRHPKPGSRPLRVGNAGGQYFIPLLMVKGLWDLMFTVINPSALDDCSLLNVKQGDGGSAAASGTDTAPQGTGTAVTARFGRYGNSYRQ